MTDSRSYLMKPILTSILMMLFCTAWGAKDSDIVAVIGKKSITLKEFNQKFQEIASKAVNPPTKEQFLEDLVRYEIGIQEGKKQNMQNDPLVRERIDQEIYKGLVEKHLAPKIKAYVPSETELRAWYDKFPEIESSHILVALKRNHNPSQYAEAKKRAEELYKEVVSSDKPFAELVNKLSDDDQTKMTGGSIGWQTSISLVPAYYNAILKTPVGKIAPLVETPYGFHIVKVTGRKEFSDANRGQLHAALIDEMRRKTFNEFFEKLKKSYPVSTKPALLK